MKIINHSDIHERLSKKADIVNDKVPLSQLPDNIVHSGSTSLIPIDETPSVDEDGITLRFTNPHNLSVGQYVVVDDNGGVIPIGIRESFFTSAKFPQMRDKRIYTVYAVPSADTLRLGTAFSSNGPSVTVNLNRAVIPIGEYFSTGSAGMYCLEKDNQGNLYVAFTDGNTTPASKITVKRFDGTSWSTVGIVGFTSEVPNGSIGFAIASDNTPYVAYKGNTTSKCIVMKYDGNNWVTVGTPLPVTGTPNYINLGIIGITPYVAYLDSNQSNKCVVMKYENSVWSMVGGSPVSDGSINSLKMKTSNGNIYVAYSDGTTTPINKLTVKMYDGTSWTTVGTKGFSSGAVVSLYSMVVNNNVPYILFYDGGISKNVICKFTAGSWSTIDSALTVAGSNYTMGITSDEKVYVTYFNSGMMKAQVAMLVSGTWQSPIIVADDFSPVGTVIGDEYYVCGKSFLNGKFIVGNLSAADNGSGNWKISNLTTKYDISDLDFNTDGGTYEIDLNGLLFQKTASSLLYLKVNDLESAIYFSPYNSSSYGSIMYSLLAISNSINAVTLKLTLKRISEDIIKVEVAGSLLPTSNATSVSGSISNIGFVGYIQGNGIENISKISFIATGCPVLNESQIIVRRVVNNDK